MEKIIELLYKDEEKFNKEAIELARENKGKINDYLLKEINQINQNIKDKKIKHAPLFLDYAIFLLAEFKEKRLFPILMDLLNNPSINSFEFIGPGIMDKLPNIVASTFDGNFETINKVIENKKIDEYTRTRLLASYTYFYDNNLITKENLEKYIKKLIILYNYQYDDIYNEILTIIIYTKISNLIEEVRTLYNKGTINLDYRGNYDSFIDDFFDYSKKYLDKINQIEDIVKEMSWWACFNKDDSKYDKSIEQMYDKFKEIIAKDTANNTNPYSKIGRNDPCPCGSGKKFKKCCIDKQKETLPYQGYIDKSLANYPKKNYNKDEIDFYTYYKEEYINIDKLLYKALKCKAIPLFIKRDKKAEEIIEYNALNEAFLLIKEIINNNNIKTIDEYDKKVSIHFSLYEFFNKYSKLLLDKVNEDKNKYLPKLEELVTIFYDNFDVQNNSLFMDRKHALYILAKRQKEGIKYFEDILNISNDNRYDIYSYLFDMYMSYYDYDEAKTKIEAVISNEKDKKLVRELQELKLEFLDDEEDYEI